MLETLVQYIESGVEVARVWGPLIILVLMAIESSFVPFPSEVVMIPAGIMIARGEFTASASSVPLAMAIAIGCGLLGSMLGAWFNYWFALRFGRPFLYRFGKYFFVKPEHLERAEVLFRRHGEITTFVCRLLPAIRQLISLPAGLARMKLGRFSFFTALGAGIWVVVLTLTGYYAGRASVGKTYRDLVFQGKGAIADHWHWVFVGLAVLVVGYVLVERRVMRRDGGAGEGQSAAG